MKTLLCLLLAVFITACSDSDQTTKSRAGSFWKEQTQLIDKAKDVEQMLKDTAALQQQRIDQQTQ